MNNKYHSYLKKAFAVYTDTLEVYEQAKEENLHSIVRADNLIRGRIGFSFFMLELLVVTKDQRILNNINKEIQWLESYVASHPTNNYTLFTGRLSIGFLYLRLYEYTRENYFLYRATSVAEEFYNSTSFYNSIVNKIGYFDGISGILNFTHNLYIYTNHSWLIKHIQRYVLTIVSACTKNQDGIFWGGISNKENKNNGLGSGTAGIAIVLQQIGDTFKDNILQAIAAKALEYEERCLEKYNVNTIEQQLLINNVLLFNNYLSTELALLYRDINKCKKIERLTCLANYIDEDFLKKFSNSYSYGLFSGLSELWITLIEASKRLGKDPFIEKIYAIESYIEKIYLKSHSNLSNTFEGKLGIGYLYIMMHNIHRPTSNLFFLPVNYLEVDSAVNSISLFGKNNILLSHTFFGTIYKKTLNALQTDVPDLYNEIMSITQKADFSEFVTLMKHKLCKYESTDKIKQIRLFFEKESFKSDILDKIEISDLYTFAEIVEADRMLQLGIDEFKLLQLEHSKGAWMLCKNSFNPEVTQFTNESVINFVQHYGSESSFYVMTSLDKLSENIPGLLQFIYERFATTTPIYVYKIIDYVIDLFLNRNKDVLPVVKEIFQALDMETLKKNIEYYIIEGIKLCVAEGLLRNYKTHPQVLVIQ